MKKRDFQIPYVRRGDSLATGDLVVAYNFPYGAPNLCWFVDHVEDGGWFSVKMSNGDIKLFNSCNHFLPEIKFRHLRKRVADEI